MKSIILKLSGVTVGDAQKNINKFGCRDIGSFALIREPDNANDPNAIRVEYRGCYIGYIPAHIAQHLAPMIDSGRRFTTCNHRLNESPYHDTVGISVELREI